MVERRRPYCVQVSCGRTELRVVQYEYYETSDYFVKSPSCLISANFTQNFVTSIGKMKARGPDHARESNVCVCVSSCCPEQARDREQTGPGRRTTNKCGLLPSFPIFQLPPEDPLFPFPVSGITVSSDRRSLDRPILSSPRSTMEIAL